MKHHVTEQDQGGSISPQLPSLIDVVFILLIFFIVLSVVGFGVVQSGSHSQGVFMKEQEISSFPAVQKALHKKMKGFIILSLDVNEGKQKEYYVFSDMPMPILGIKIQDPKEYQSIKTKILNRQFDFNGASTLQPLKTLESVWGPFADADAMCSSPLVNKGSNSDLIIQANEEFTYHEILQVLRFIRQYKSIFFEVIENEKRS